MGTSSVDVEESHGPVAVIVQNPINEHLEGWMNIVAPRTPKKESDWTKNQETLEGLRKRPGTTAYVIRAENFWDDLLTIEQALGNPNAASINRMDWPGVSDPAVGIRAGPAIGKIVSFEMCCHLKE